MPTVAVMWPYDQYDFGFGIPVILSTGTDISDAQLTQLHTIVDDMVPKERPRLLLIDGPAPVPDTTLFYATQAYVDDAIAAIPGAVAIKHHQTSPAATWTIPHNRDTKPDIVLLTDDDGDERVYTDVSYPDDATVVVEWPAPTTGWAYIN